MINARSKNPFALEPSATLAPGALPVDDRPPFLPIEVPIPFALDPGDYPTLLSHGACRDLGIRIPMQEAEDA